MDSSTATPEERTTVSRGDTKVVVLGSHGGQQITQLTGSHLRCGTSMLIDVGGEVTVVDCGCGSVHRLAEAGYDAHQVRTVLVTHCHADHVAELGSLVSFAWSSGRNGADPDRRLDVYGPTGTGDYEAGLKRSLARSIADQEGPLAQTPPFDAFATWHEFTPPPTTRTLVERPDLVVQAIRVRHGSMPSVGYRVRTPDVDVAISGDRGVGGDSFDAFAAGADVLVHEVIDRPLVTGVLEAEGAAPSFVRHLVDDHTDAPDVGRTATAAGVDTLVLYHLIPGNPAITDDRWVDLVRPTYDGAIVVARDLMVI
ncbi:MAG: MBL fold metallo-hydrolase [Acidimicrobiales bacterium]|nr:MBL fold metallo-hydrolase [Actinomycetota bacterium]